MEDIKNLIIKFKLICLILFPSLIWGQEEVKDAAKEAQNPLGNVISLPLQDNIDFGVGNYGKTANTLNIQPVIPVSLSEEKKWLLMNRLIIPFPKSVPDRFNEDASGTSGLGDISYTAWFAPPAKGNITWGFGATTVFPTASQDELGQGKLSIGPSLVFVYTNPKFMAVGIMSNWKSVAGDEDRLDVHTFYFQYIFTYFLQKKWYLSSAPINLANWEAETDQRWTVPLGGGFGKMFKIGNLPMDFQTQAFYNVVKPDMSADWQWRLQLKLIFPTGKKK